MTNFGTRPQGRRQDRSQELRRETPGFAGKIATPPIGTIPNQSLMRARSVETICLYPACGKSQAPYAGTDAKAETGLPGGVRRAPGHLGRRNLSGRDQRPHAAAREPVAVVIHAGAKGRAADGMAAAVGEVIAHAGRLHRIADGETRYRLHDESDAGADDRNDDFHETCSDIEPASR